MSVWQLINTGGYTMYVLIFLSIVSLAIIFERAVYFRKMSSLKRGQFMTAISQALKKGSVQEALTICKTAQTAISKVVTTGLELHGSSEELISNAMERTITIQTTKLEHLTSIVGTIGSTSVYIGLFGTVLGIIRAFHDISKSGSGGINIVINGISEALVCTAAGLLVAVPAVMAYNYFVRRIDTLVMDMELCASETLDLLSTRRK